MKKKALIVTLAALTSLGVAVTGMADDDTSETEIIIDLSEYDLEDGGELDLSELFGDDFEFDFEEGDTDEDEDYDEDDAFLDDDNEVYWYTVRYHEDNQDMVMLNDVIVYLPEDWTDQYDMIIGEDRVDFYHRASRAGWYLYDGSDGGLLFSLRTSADESYQDSPQEFVDLGEGSDGLYYYLAFPSDLQAYAEDDDITDAYEQLYSEIDQVKEEAFSLNDYIVGEDDFDFEELDEEETEF